MLSKSLDPLDSKVLGKLMLMQNFVINLPNEDSIFSFVCKGLLDVPGIEKAKYYGNQEEISNHESKKISLPIQVDDSFYGYINLTLSDTNKFQPYQDYLSNFMFMIGVILEQKKQRKLLANHQLKLEQQVKERTEQLNNEKQLLQTIIDTIPVMVTIYDSEVNSVILNNAVENITGWTNEDAQHNNIMELAYPDPEYREHVLGFMAALQPVFQDLIMRTKDGRDIETTWANVEIPDGRSVGVGVDISERKELESQLIEAKEKAEENRRLLKTIVNATPDLIWVKDTNGIYLNCNKRFEDFFGKSKSEIIGKTDYDFVEKELADFFRNHDNRAMNAGGPIINEEEITFAIDGHSEILETIKTPLAGSNNDIIGVLGVGRDITDRKKAEEKLLKAKKEAEESEKQLRLISDNFVNGMIYQVAMLDENRRQFNYISNNVQDLYGCTEEEAKEDANLIYGKLHPDDVEGLIEKEKEALKNMSVFEAEARAITPNGNIRWAYFISKPRIINGVACWDGIEIDITERKQMEIELRKAKEKAEESDRLKSAFLANMSHEIRTPMNGILGFTSLLQEHDLTGAQQQKYIEIIKKSGNRMLSTVNDIIEISKIDSGQITINSNKLNISKHILALYDFFNFEATKKGLKLTLENKLSENESFIISDKNKLDSILTNLIKNAIKFTEKGSIKIGCEKKVDLLEFYVKDTGIGIPAARKDAVFNRFEQADIEDKQAREGSGLGLAIVKSYVEMLGGTVWVESEENKGSTFFFTVSYKPVKSETKSKTKVQNKISDKAKNLNILIVEDDDVSSLYLSTIIKDIAKNIQIARNGTEAVEICKNNSNFDLVLMDIKLPGMNGLEATEKIRKFNKKVKIIAQTAHALQGDREQARISGCDDYIAKPINKGKLIEMIDRYFE
ncbi:PAS domain-containing hybrid sensor histidine kinase/response regulator [Draconibacterium halophilum]|uniref:Sensory/regulatory protein RpfC n=1 Tax=Draconibacterium halophilum TaxID=2706887 RepID=A0A6C0R9X7_9BACT|nr:PAS domain-containing hybrid sensor histidine kinase/response regulator [Draconibacterium halophilum]QIA06223.1 PAS domain S-box protein [Draconibacterium halophilum]